MGSLIERYAWVKEIEAWTVAVIEDKTPADVIRIYGGDPTAPVGDYLFSQMADLQGDVVLDDIKFHLQVIQSGDRVVVLENNGWSGSLPEIARRCSVNGGAFFSVYWNVNASGKIVQACNGKVTAFFDFLYPIAPEAAQFGEVRPEWATGPEVDDDLIHQTCFALLEEQAGVKIDPYWLGEQRPTYRIPEPYWMLKDVEGAEVP